MLHIKKILILLLSALLFCCTYNSSNSASKYSNNNFNKDLGSNVKTSFGVGFTPPNYPFITLEDYRQGLLEAASIGTHLSYIYDWDGGDEAFENVNMIIDSAKTLNLITLLQFSPTGIGNPAPPSDLEFLPKSFNNPDLREKYLNDVERLAKFNPDYLNLCAELNLMYLFNWQEYEYFKSLYCEAYDLVKEISPKTLVGVSYHLDIFFVKEQFGLIHDLGPQDFIGYTSYPAHLVYEGYFSSIEELPVFYYSRIKTILESLLPDNPDIPILFTEIGWPSSGNGSYEDQAEFIRRIPELMQEVQPAVISWVLLHDVDYFQVWKLNQIQLDILEEYDVDPGLLFSHLNGMGLISQDGLAKPGWFEALNLGYTTYY